MQAAYASLLDRAGFALEREFDTHAEITILEAIAFFEAVTERRK